MTTPNRADTAPQELKWNAYVCRIATGDQDALSSLYNASNHLVYGLALRILGNPADAEEITLDTYSQIWRSAERFDADRGSAATWLLTMARSRAIDRLRSGAVRNSHEEPLTDLALYFGSRQPHRAGFDYQVKAALDALCAEQREAIELAYWFGFSHSELQSINNGTDHGRSKLLCGCGPSRRSASASTSTGQYSSGLG